MSSEDRHEQAAGLRAWLDRDPERAAEILQAGLAMLAVHGYQPSSGEPLRWDKVEPDKGQG